MKIYDAAGKFVGKIAKPEQPILYNGQWYEIGEYRVPQIGETIITENGTVALITSLEKYSFWILIEIPCPSDDVGVDIIGDRPIFINYGSDIGHYRWALRERQPAAAEEFEKIPITTRDGDWIATKSEYGYLVTTWFSHTRFHHIKLRSGNRVDTLQAFPADDPPRFVCLRKETK